MKGKTLKDVIGAEERSLYKLITLIAELSAQVREMIPRELGFAGGINPYGEKQLQIDVWSNDLFTKKLLRSGLVKRIASEEMEEVAESKAGEYSIVLDPLDGSSNLKSNNLLGTIVGVYREKPLPARGRDLYAAMYFLYGPFHQLVLALQDGVRTFAALGRGSEGTRFVEFVESLEKRKLSLRYGGSFVGDYNQVLTRGGFFAYPELTDAPEGKYRLQFESNPVGFITEKAGGQASTGMGRILDVEPTSIVQRVPTYLGDSELVQEFQSTYKSKGQTV